MTIHDIPAGVHAPNRRPDPRLSLPRAGKPGPSLGSLGSPGSGSRVTKRARRALAACRNAGKRKCRAPARIFRRRRPRRRRASLWCRASRLCPSGAHGSRHCYTAAEQSQCHTHRRAAQTTASPSMAAVRPQKRSTVGEEPARRSMKRRMDCGAASQTAPSSTRARPSAARKSWKAKSSTGGRGGAGGGYSVFVALPEMSPKKSKKSLSGLSTRVVFSLPSAFR